MIDSSENYYIGGVNSKDLEKRIEKMENKLNRLRDEMQDIREHTYISGYLNTVINKICDALEYDNGVNI